MVETSTTNVVNSSESSTAVNSADSNMTQKKEEEKAEVGIAEGLVKEGKAEATEAKDAKKAYYPCTVRPATKDDVQEIYDMIRELAVFENCPDQLAITPETFLKDGGFLEVIISI